MRICVLAALALLSMSACASPYYEACGPGGICPGGLLCAAPGTIDVCTTLCSSPEECTREHGDGSFCSLGGVCLERCMRDADCPITAYCDTMTSTCVR